uniref:Uncharacterized protein n=1 Tax=Periophthalmus magnuspinnatus TaxID=409849 RepID=A0A3B4AV58_9GOBI
MAAVLPRTLGELQLYRILQRANLLYYYEAFIQQGGDDVQQLCEAGEEEFLEIMALVGMASKPLHVRRLQKALRDWVTNPAIFNQPLTSLPVCSIPVYKLPEGSPSLLPAQDRPSSAKMHKALSCSDPGKLEVTREKVSASPLQGGSETRFWSGHSNDSEHSLSPSDLGSPSSPREGLEALDAAAVQSVLECVERMAPGLPKSDISEVKEQLKTNKKLAKMIGHIFDMSEEDPRREEEIRKYSAIYGRFDSKRRDGKHLTLHELTVNEAAAQLCMRDMALLTRRDELFGLARQISREVTYKYTYRTSKSRCGDRDEPSPKRIKTEENFFDLQEALQAIHMRQEMLREQLACAKSKGEETVGRNLQVRCSQVFKGHSKVKCALFIFVNVHFIFLVSDINQSMAEGELPLGKQLANELKRHHNHNNSSSNHNNNNNNNTNSNTNSNSHSSEEAKAPAAGGWALTGTIENGLSVQYTHELQWILSR